MELFARVQLLCNNTNDGYRAHEEDGIVELQGVSGGFFANDKPLTAFLETSRSSSSVLASIKRRRRFGKLAWRNVSAQSLVSVGSLDYHVAGG